MRLFLSRLSVAALTAWLVLAAVRVASAETIKYPPEKPLLTFTLPSGWTTKDAHDGSNGFYCSGPKNEVQFQLYTVADTELNDDLKGFAQGALKAGGAKDADFVKDGDRDLPSGISAHFVRMRFQMSGGKFASLFVSFPIDDSNHCVIHTFLLDENLSKHQDELDKILNSIKMLK